MIKVLNIISDTNIGGAGRALLNYLKHMDKSAFDVSVALPRGSKLCPFLKELNVKIYETESMADKSFDLRAIWELRGIIKTDAPDIVHAHGSLSGRIAAKSCRKKIIFTKHSAFALSPAMRSGPLHFVNKFINEHYADRIIAVGMATKENLLAGGISEKYIDTMMNGVERVPRPSAEAVREFRTAHSVDDNDFVLGILARIEIYKGHSTILDAMSTLISEGRSVKLLIGGTGTYEEELRRLVREKGLENHVEFCGFISDISLFLGSLDVQINASTESETSSLSLLEGMSMGLVAVASDCSGNPYVIEDGENGLLFSPGDSRDLTGKLRVLMDDPHYLEQLSLGALRIYEEKFTAEIFARNVEKTYHRVQEGRDG